MQTAATTRIEVVAAVAFVKMRQGTSLHTCWGSIVVSFRPTGARKGIGKIARKR